MWKEEAPRQWDLPAKFTTGPSSSPQLFAAPPPHLHPPPILHRNPSSWQSFEPSQYKISYSNSNTFPMATQPPQIRSLYRRLLRELPTTTSTTPSTRSASTPPKFRSTSHQKLSAPSALQARIRSSFTNLGGADEASQIAQAEQFVQYVQAQRMYATLIERYNPGMGMSEEERVRLSARRVGVDLPTEFGKTGQ